MVRQGKDGPDYGPLEIRAGGLGRLVGCIVLLAVAEVFRIANGGGLLGRVDDAVMALLALVLVVSAVRYGIWRAKGVLVRLDETGITLLGGSADDTGAARGATVRWDEIGEVRNIIRGRTDAVIFVPRDEDAELPVLSLALFRLRPRGAGERLSRRWGSRLVLFPGGLDVSTTEVIDAVRRFGRLRVLDEKRELVVS